MPVTPAYRRPGFPEESLAFKPWFPLVAEPTSAMMIESVVDYWIAVWPVHAARCRQP